MTRKLPRTYFLNPDVVALARDLLGKVIVLKQHETTFRAVIAETEAYAGVEDRASHAWNGRFTKRTATMYAQGGTLYVYLCYGIHHLMNIVSNEAGIPHAILLRAAWVQDVPGAVMKYLNGPGKLTKHLGINMEFNGCDLLHSDCIHLEDHGINISSEEIIITPRIGVDYAGGDADLPYRFLWKPVNPPELEYFNSQD
jgi:DNA-3-methyladenine glycosylase